MKPRRVGRICCIALLCCLTARLAAAETTVQVYTGTAVTRDTDVDVDVEDPLSPVVEQEHISDHYHTIGGRYTVWFDSRPWLGAAGDISHFHVDSDAASIETVPVCALLMARHAGAAWIPYGGVGVCAANYEVDVPGLLGTEEGISDRSYAGGWDLHAGISYAFTTHFSGFLEYRYTRFEINYKHTADPVPPAVSAINEHVTARPVADHFLAGIAYLY